MTSFNITSTASDHHGGFIPAGYSPVGHHALYDDFHKFLFYLHDFSAITTLVLFAVLYNLNRTKENQWFHKWIGRFLFIPVTLTLISGFSLVYYLKVDGPIHDVSLARITIRSQGYCAVVAILNAFVFQRYVKDVWLSKTLLFLHFCSICTGLRSFFLCINSVMGWKIGGYTPLLQYRIVAFEFLTVITIPQLVTDSCFFMMHWTITSYPALLKTMYWKDFHEMCSMSVIYFVGIGAVFSFSHDKYWIFSYVRPTGLTLLERIPIIFAPLIYILLFKVHRFIVPMMRILNWPKQYAKNGAIGVDSEEIVSLTKQD